MGKGDKKSRKGKIVMGSYGNSRPGGNKAPKTKETGAEKIPTTKEVEK